MFFSEYRLLDKSDHVKLFMDENILENMNKPPRNLVLEQ